MRYVAVIFAAALLNGQAGAPAAAGNVEIRGGESIQITARAGLSFSLRFAAVISDERCPARVRCAWANPPVIALDASAPGKNG